MWLAAGFNGLSCIMVEKNRSGSVTLQAVQMFGSVQIDSIDEIVISANVAILIAPISFL